MSRFKLATREKIKLRLALEGVSGSGKTYTALQIASAFGDKILVIDTENGSANRYAGDGIPFYSEPIEPPFNPRKLTNIIKEAEEEGFDVVIVDSLTHFWKGEGGILDIVDDVKARNRTKGNKNGFTAWKDGNAFFMEVLNKIIHCKIHIICTMRSKAEYLQTEDSRGRKKIEKVGTAAEMRDGLEYEFDVVLDLDLDHNATISKSRCKDLPTVIRQPDVKLGQQLMEWCETGTVPEPRQKAPAPKPVRQPEPEPEPKSPVMWDKIDQKQQRRYAMEFKDGSALVDWAKVGDGYESVYDWAQQKSLLGWNEKKQRVSIDSSSQEQIELILKYLAGLAKKFPVSVEDWKAEEALAPPDVETMESNFMAHVKSTNTQLWNALLPKEVEVDVDPENGMLDITLPEGFGWHGEVIEKHRELIEKASGLKLNLTCPPSVHKPGTKAAAIGLPVNEEREYPPDAQAAIDEQAGIQKESEVA